MKVIKKITAIMLSIMMVLGMSSVVSAAGTSGIATPTGSITINNAAQGETYNIYRILDLESYSGSGESGNYAYKLRSDKVAGSTNSWSDFIESSAIKDVYVTIDGDYVTWKNGVATTKDKAAEFAKLALEYAKDNTTKIVADKTEPAPAVTSGATTSTVSFSDLPLGYYLVETSVGTVLALDTTKPDATIEEKNGVPSVEKKVQEDSKIDQTEEYGKSNTADIGQTINFKTAITVRAGAQNYVLHDKMSDGLTFDSDSVVIKKSTAGTEETLTKISDYTVEISSLESTTPCTFHIKFNSDYCNGLKNDDKLIVTYSAKLNSNAVIGGTGNENDTWLGYGDSSETTHSNTFTKTYEIPVFKYTGTNTGLSDAVFKLYRDEACTDAKQIKFVSLSKDGEYDVYRIVTDGETVTADQIKTDNTGKFKIRGLDADTYYLKEVTAPKGYNKLSKAVKIEIDKDGNIKVDDIAIAAGGDVKVLNKSGSLLPSTGGRGTTLFYILGAILVVGSGVVLITKKRMK